jgi:hypothetical protein
MERNHFGYDVLDGRIIHQCVFNKYAVKEWALAQYME